MRTRSNSIVRLDWYHHLVTSTILDFQDPVTGLLPPRVKWNTEDHQSSEFPKHAWVRDNVYSIIAVWALALAYRKNADMDEDRAKAYELTQAVVKCMRGLLSSMMRQAEKVESFKTSQSRADSLHAKYDIATGSTCVSDHAWGHLQIDATSLYLLILAQMTASGIQLVFTVDEVAFVQNLVFYIEKSYSIPEIAASLLSVISFPAFAVEDKELVDITRDEIIDELQGKYGLCRFLRDGYKTPVEDPHRLHYEPAELEIFQHLECEWPLFYCYLILDGLYLDRPEQAKKYTNLLDELLIRDETGLILVPELFYVPREKVAEEKSNPHSVERTRGEFAPHMWSQSLYIVASLLQEKFIAIGELDPLNRRHSTENRPDVVVQVALLAEDEIVSQLLCGLDVPVQLVSHVENIEVLPAHVLGMTYQQLGKCTDLNLTGRPIYNIGALASSTLYRMGTGLFAFTPQFLDYHQFYLCLDNEFLADRLKSLVGYLGANWRLLGRPTLTLLVTNSMMEDSQSSCIAKLILKLKGGYISGVRVRLGFLSDFLSTSCVTTLHFVRDYGEQGIRSMQKRLSTSKDILKRSDSVSRERTPSFVGGSPEARSTGRISDVSGAIKRSRSISIYCDKDNMSMGVPSRKETFEERVANGWSPTRSRTLSLLVDSETKQYIKELEESSDIYDQADIMHFLYKTKGPDFDTHLFGAEGTTIEKLLEELYEKACEYKAWSLVRHTAGLLQKEVEDLAETLLYHILSGKEFGISDGSIRNVSEKQLSIINIDLPKRVGMKKLSKAIKKMGVVTQLSRSLSEHRGLKRQVANPDIHPSHLNKQESADYAEEHDQQKHNEHHEDEREGNWVRRRCLDGALNRVPEDFYRNVWKVLEKCHWLTIYKNNLPSAMVREMTARELKFALCVEGALNRIPEPEYRQLIVEALMVMALVVENYPDQPLWDTVDVDDLVYQGYKIYLKEQAAIGGDSTVCCARPVHEQISCGGACGICRYFYDTAPSGRFGTMTYFSKAVATKLSYIPHENECVLS
ncbi:Phosphorylase b kinase regulatory subunit alpha, liver isoform [Exaiptasia diaphana]|nr:Phosphorylase b kinase regulatory subunit alpha, liver isoform [Exaiptasia diaphana]